MHALPLSAHFPHSVSSLSCCGLLVALVLLAGPGDAQSSPSISIALSPGHTVPQNTALTATITLNNLDAASYSSLIFRADLTEFDPHFEAESASCEDEDMGEDITIEVDGSQETFTVRVYKACSHDIYAHYTLDAKIFQVDPSVPDGKVQLAAASTRFSMSRFLRPGEMTLPPPAPGVAAWLDPDPETFAWYVGEWVQFRARTDVSLYLNHHLGVLAYGSEPGQVADQTSSLSLDAEEACREVEGHTVHWRRAINQPVWLVVCKPGTAFIEVRHETDAVAPLREYEFRILAPPPPPPPPPPRGGPNGHVDYCRDYGPCSAGEGDCDGNSECQSGLQCRQDVGASYGFRADYDVCEAAAGGGTNGHVDYCQDYGPCRVGEGDCDGSGECQSGLQCRQDVGASYGFRAAYDVCEAAAGGGPNGHVDYCRDYGPCRVGEGDCDGNSQCQSGLECRQDVGASYGFPANYDVCEAAAGGGRNGHVDYCRDYGPCGVGEGDCDGSGQCQSGLQCSQDVGASYGFRVDYDVCEATAGGGQNGHVDYCRDEGPCRTGEGDCDRHSECQSGLQCSWNVGATYGFPANYDMCEAAAGGGTNGHVDYCRDEGPCGVGEGDCDGSGQCQSGLQCSQDIGAHYGFRAAYDVCEAAAGGGTNGHVDYCRDYGPCGVGEGDCDRTSECQSGLECRRNVGTTYGFPAAYDVCE